MSKRAFYCISDSKNLKYFTMLKNSLRKFDKDTDFILFGDQDVNAAADKQIFYRATPYFAKQLFKQGYTELCHLDADQIIVGGLEDVWEGDFDAAVVLNDPSYPIQVWDIAPYFNNGFNVFKSEAFIDHWLRLCLSPHFDRYQFREQDLLNILCSDYLNYNIRVLDSDKAAYGESVKGQWAKSELKDGKIMLPENKELRVIHFGGGEGAPDKGNYQIHFNEDITKYIDGLVK